MIDPITIGIAFTAAQQAVAGIKKAIALGKDIKSLHGQFSSFFENSDTVHKASFTAQTSTLLTDGQIRAKSLEIAMQAKELRDHENELRTMLIWSGNKDVWDQMLAERVRMFKERAAEERRLEKEKQIKNEKLLDQILIFLCFAALCVPVFFTSLYFIMKN